MNLNFNRLLRDFEKCKNKGKIAAWFAALLFIFYLIKEGSAYLRKLGENRSARKTYEAERKADAALHVAKVAADVAKAKALKDMKHPEQPAPANGEVSVPSYDPYVSKVASFKDSLENDMRELEWLVGKKIEVGGRCLIYGPAGVGKSAFALQTAIAIAGGTDYGFLPSEEENQHETQQVILIDLEMSAAEQKERTRGITIPDNLLRNTEPIYNLDELFLMIENESHAPKVTVIIDNIRKLEEEMSQTYQVNEYFSKLEQTQEKLAAKGIIVTFITITHTGKDFDMYKPVQLSDIAGGADLARFSTSVYALVPGRDGKVVFKALKQRNTARMEDVYVLRIKESPNLHLDFVCTSNDGDALPVKPKGGKADKSIKPAYEPKKKGNTKVDEDDIEKMVALSDQGKTYADIVKELNLQIGEHQVGRIVRAEKAKQKPEGGNQAA
jgi:KaiC/GvpD/RAD55 family RecA-like ATPase